MKINEGGKDKGLCEHGRRESLERETERERERERERVRERERILS